MRRPSLLQTTAAVSWTAAITGAFTGYDDNTSTFSAVDERIWIAVLAVAVVSSILATQQAMAAKAARTYAAVNVTAATRPRADQPSGEFPALRPVPYTQPSRHATRG